MQTRIDRALRTSVVLLCLAAPAAPAQDAAPGTVLRDCPQCPEMVVLPASKFVMGSPKSESAGCS